MTKRVVVIGGGWSGCAAALAAYMAGASSVVIIERTDYLLGTGLVGGIMRNNGRFTAAEEMIAMGAGTLFEVCDEVSVHKNFDFPGHKHASLYDVTAIEPAVRRVLDATGIDIKLIHRVTKVNTSNGSIDSIHLENGSIGHLSPEGNVVVANLLVELLCTPGSAARGRLGTRCPRPAGAALTCRSDPPTSTTTSSRRPIPKSAKRSLRTRLSRSGTG